MKPQTEQRRAIIAEARTWVKTPWRHQGRLKGVACDCVGVIVKVPAALGLLPADFDITGYPRTPDPEVMRRGIEEWLDPVKAGEETGGDILWLKPGRLPHHLGILTYDDSIIHAIDLHRGVTEHRFDLTYRSMVTAVFKYRGLDE